MNNAPAGWLKHAGEQAGSTPDETTAIEFYRLNPSAALLDFRQRIHGTALAPDETLREALRFVRPLHEAAAEALIDEHGDDHREALRLIDRALATPTKPEMQPEGLVSSCQALSETAGESAKKSTLRLLEWIEEAVEYVNTPTMSPSLEDEGRALLAAGRAS